MRGGGVPALWVSIDPGDSHVGYAVWKGEECLTAVEVSPNGLIYELEQVIDQLGLIVLEKFQLFGWQAQQQAGSDMKTAQLIGVIKYLASRSQVPLVLQTPSYGKAVYRLAEFKQQPARWWKSWGHGSHAKDAEAHGYAFIRGKRRGL